MIKVSVVAELTTNHFGDREKLDKMIRWCHSDEADYVKLQKRDVDTFYSPEQLAAPYVTPISQTFGEYRHQLELGYDDFVFVDELCRELGIGWFASVLDRPSYEFMLQFEPAIIKLPSTISEHTHLLRHVARTFKGAVVISTGMTDVAYEQFVLDTFAQAAQLYLLQCSSGYPTPLTECNIEVVRHYAELARTTHPNIIPGYSGHDYGWLPAAMAVAAGARMVEKHVKLTKTPWAHYDDVAASLYDDHFSRYVRYIRMAQDICGDGVKVPTKSETHKYHPHRDIDDLVP